MRFYPVPFCPEGAGAAAAGANDASSGAGAVAPSTPNPMNTTGKSTKSPPPLPLSFIRSFSVVTPPSASALEAAGITAAHIGRVSAASVAGNDPTTAAFGLPPTLSQLNAMGSAVGADHSSSNWAPTVASQQQHHAAPPPPPPNVGGVATQSSSTTTTTGATASAVEETPEQRAEKRRKKRQRIVQEIVETERKYVQCLTALEQLYVTPARTGGSGGGGGGSGGSSGGSTGSSASGGGGGSGGGEKVGLSDTEQMTLFSVVVVIRDLNAKFLLDLEKRFEAWSDDSSCIGDLFVQFAPYFKMYVFYVYFFYFLFRAAECLL